MKISVIIPTHNRRAHVLRLLEELFSQDFPISDYEVIVVVDGSHDGTKEALAGLRPRANFRWRYQLNRGLSNARNAGLELATGELVLFLDDDMRCTPALLAAHVAAHGGVSPAVVLGVVWVAPGLPDTPVIDRLREDTARGVTRQFSRGLCWPDDAHMGANCSAPRELIQSVGAYDESLTAHEDTDLGFRLWSLGIPFRFAPEAEVWQDYCKDALTFVVGDGARLGISQVRFCRKHPAMRPYTELGMVYRDVSWWKRIARQVSVRVPLPARAIGRVCCRVARPARWITPQGGAVALQAGRTVMALRAAVRELGAEGVREYTRGTAALVYHHIGEPASNRYPGLTIGRNEFERHLNWLRQHHYTGISATDWLEWRRGRRELPHKPVILCFDDAYAETAEFALPLLREHGFSATVFVVTSQIGGSNLWDQNLGRAEEIPLMTAEQIRLWAAVGIEFGSHTCSHANLRQLSDDELRHELADSKQQLAALIGRDVECLSYPFGAHDARVREYAGALYSGCFTTDEGLNHLGTSPGALRRTNVHPGDAGFDLRMRAALGYSPIRIAARRLRRAVQKFSFGFAASRKGFDIHIQPQQEPSRRSGSDIE